MPTTDPEYVAASRCIAAGILELSLLKVQLRAIVHTLEEGYAAQARVMRRIQERLPGQPEPDLA